MAKFITYLRVSTQKQGESGLGLEAQRNTVKIHAQQKKADIIAEFVEVESGKKNDRPKLTEAIQYAKENNAILLIAKLDRLSRNAGFIFKLRDTGVQFECCDIPDANTLTIGIFATVAQHERERISERTRQALAAKKARGERLGKPDNLDDSARIKGAQANKMKAEQNEANKRAKLMAVSLRQSGKSFQQIANELNSNGFYTPTGKHWNVGSLNRLVNR